LLQNSQYLAVTVSRLFHAESPACRLRENSTYDLGYFSGGLPYHAGSDDRKVATWTCQRIDPIELPIEAFGQHDAVLPALQTHVSREVLAADKMQCYYVTKPEPLLLSVCSHSHLNNWDSGFLVYPQTVGQQ